MAAQGQVVLRERTIYGVLASGIPRFVAPILVCLHSRLYIDLYGRQFHTKAT